MIICLFKLLPFSVIEIEYTAISLYNFIELNNAIIISSLKKYSYKKYYTNWHKSCLYRLSENLELYFWIITQ